MRSLRPLLFCGAVATGVIGFGFAGVGHAQDMPCTEEIQRFCADVQPGGGRILQCLKRNESQLSHACVKRMDDFQAAVSGPLGAACREDWVAVCYHPRASTDRRAMVQCLEANQARLSPGCQKALQSSGGKGQRSRGMVQ